MFLRSHQKPQDLPSSLLFPPPPFWNLGACDMPKPGLTLNRGGRGPSHAPHPGPRGWAAQGSLHATVPQPCPRARPLPRAPPLPCVLGVGLPGSQGSRAGAGLPSWSRSCPLWGQRDSTGHPLQLSLSHLEPPGTQAASVACWGLGDGGCHSSWDGGCHSSFDLGVSREGTASATW